MKGEFQEFTLISKVKRTYIFVIYYRIDFQNWINLVYNP